VVLADQRAAAERDRTRGLRRSGLRSPLPTGLLMTPISTLTSVLAFACLLVCLMAMASFSISAPRLSRCLHHHKPGDWGPGGAATQEEAVNTHSNARFGREVEWNVSRNDCFLRRL